MTTLKFILRKSNRGNLFEGRISARLIHERKVRVSTLAIGLFPNEWNEQEEKIIFGEEGTQRYRYLNRASEALKNYREQFSEVIECLEKQGSYDVRDINIGYQNRQDMSSLQGFTSYLSRRIEKSGQGRTARAYLTTCRAFRTFNKGADIPLKYINSYMIKEFETYLKERSKSMNTISYYMRMLRAIYRKAVKEKLIENRIENPFEKVFTGFQRTRKRALSVEQLRALNTLDYSQLLEDEETKDSLCSKEKKDDGLYDSWRYFFFCFHARGMSYVDMAYLRKENIRHGVISYYRKKTGQMIEITVTPVLKRIIDSFAGDVKFTPYVFPIIKDINKSHRTQYETGLNTQNRRLKILAKKAALVIDWGLSTHVSRHSWATTGKVRNLPMSVISEGLGHKSERTTTTYLASFDSETIDKASEAIDMAIICPSAIYKQAYHTF